MIKNKIIYTGLYAHKGDWTFTSWIVWTKESEHLVNYKSRTFIRLGNYTIVNLRISLAEQQLLMDKVDPWHVKIVRMAAYLCLLLDQCLLSVKILATSIKIEKSEDC